MKTLNFRNIRNIALAGVLSLSAASCDHSLDIEPKYDVVSANVYRDFANYKSILAKMYAGYAVTGQQGPAGRPDISGIDEGFSNYLRQYWQAQELSTDEAIIAWNDGTLRDLHDMDWTPANEFLRALYNRIFYQVSLTNEFIRETQDAQLSERGITGANLEEARRYRAEARFLRALSYWHALDLYGNVPFVTEQDRVGSFFPEQTTRADLFSYVESELLAIESELGEPGFEYGRADKAAAWTLLAKLYLNAEVYTGQGRYADAVTYSRRVIDSGRYQLEAEYGNLFLADNHTSSEIIFPITFDGLRTTTWGGMTYLVHAPVGGNMNAAAFGINGGWGGLRTTKNIVELFPSTNATPDERAMFHTDGQNLEIADIFTFTDGYPITKFKNVNRAGQAGSDPSGNHPDTDFPMFRLADVYLMYAEAVLRGGGGSAADALDYVNQLRRRAYTDATGNVRGNGGAISQGQLTLDFIINERARELKWEGHRRTDLIRFNRFTSATYVWPWKGAVPEGRGVEEFRRLYPIPSTDLTANPNLTQNPGYTR
ncbi:MULTISPECIES: RagB/SusD family nutrient uptake outer membrane protein [Pontibacter]|uniref:Starch-binding associating with outer membrane n=1 Tax=Pontibacter lucknowensis TaxID=1077936 RepID=A0A1N6ZI47_9BACT|nr:MULTISPECIES: RagB/SusD family nutrient uptake outer membrane protein [Pontibacter]EJF09104.1 RagB/SusD domain-containing protein [Pontibacter sp. BAB1700]SIR26406.1 Starch-binding associating with outer membrane [Pontibacter lucknowensis]